MSLQEMLDLVTAETAQQVMAKEAKLDVAEKALMLGHKATISQDEEDTVRRYRDMKVFGGDGAKTAENGGKKDMRIVVCDDYKVVPEVVTTPASQSQPPSSSPMLPWLLTASLAAGGAGLGLGWLLNRGNEQQPPVIEKKVETPQGTTTTTVKGVGSTVELVQPK